MMFGDSDSDAESDPDFVEYKALAAANGLSDEESCYQIAKMAALGVPLTTYVQQHRMAQATGIGDVKYINASLIETCGHMHSVLFAWSYISLSLSLSLYIYIHTSMSIRTLHIHMHLFLASCLGRTVQEDPMSVEFEQLMDKQGKKFEDRMHELKVMIVTRKTLSEYLQRKKYQSGATSLIECGQCCATLHESAFSKNQQKKAKYVRMNG
jgi:hypothetical protein